MFWKPTSEAPENTRRGEGERKRGKGERIREGARKERRRKKCKGWAGGFLG
jgi:hypothetical protein